MYTFLFQQMPITICCRYQERF